MGSKIKKEKISKRIKKKFPTRLPSNKKRVKVLIQKKIIQDVVDIETGEPGVRKKISQKILLLPKKEYLKYLKEKEKKENEYKRISKKFERLANLSLEEWRDSREEVFFKKFKEFIEKMEKEVNNKLQKAETEKSKDKLMKLKKKIETIKNTRSDIFK